MYHHTCPRCGRIFPEWQPVHFSCLFSRLRYILKSLAVLVLVVVVVGIYVRFGEQIYTQIEAHFKPASGPDGGTPPKIVITVPPQPLPPVVEINPKPNDVPPKQPGPVPPQPPAKGAGTQKYVSTRQVNVRSGPGKSTKVVTKLSQGQSVTTFENVKSSDGATWVRVRAGNSEGWINEKLLSDSSSPEPPPPVTTQQAPQPAVAEGTRKYVNTRQINVRSGPGTNNKVITKLLQGESVTAYESKQDSKGIIWIRISAGVFEGWVNEKLLSDGPPSSLMPVP